MWVGGRVVGGGPLCHMFYCEFLFKLDVVRKSLWLNYEAKEKHQSTIMGCYYIY